MGWALLLLGVLAVAWALATGRLQAFGASLANRTHLL